MPLTDRINHLRRWAGLQCTSIPKEIPAVCGKHPTLALMGAEIMETWKEPRFICTERPFEECYRSMEKVSWCWHPSAAKYAFNRLADAREEFFEKYQPSLLRIQYDALKSAPEQMLSELCDFLQHNPPSSQRKNALTLINETNDDCCIPHTAVKQPVQMGSVPIPSCKKHYKKGKKR